MDDRDHLPPGVSVDDGSSRGQAAVEQSMEALGAALTELVRGLEAAEVRQRGAALLDPSGTAMAERRRSESLISVSREMKSFSVVSSWQARVDKG